VRGGDQGGVVVPAEVGASLVVVEAELALELAVVELELYPDVVDACEEEGGVPSRLIKTDRREAGKEGTLLAVPPILADLVGACHARDTSGRGGRTAAQTYTKTRTTSIPGCRRAVDQRKATSVAAFLRAVSRPRGVGEPVHARDLFMLRTGRSSM
jgi:hypothetical protein